MTLPARVLAPYLLLVSFGCGARTQLDVLQQLGAAPAAGPDNAGGGAASTSGNASSDAGAAGAPETPMPQPVVEPGHWTAVCDIVPNGDGWVKDFKADSSGTAFFVGMDSSGAGRADGRVIRCSRRVDIDQIAESGRDMWPRGATLLMTDQHLLIASVVPTSHLILGEHGAIMEWNRKQLTPYGVSPRSDLVLLAADAAGASYAIYPKEDPQVLRQYDGSDWHLLAALPSPQQQVRALGAAPGGNVYVVSATDEPPGRPATLEIAVWQSNGWQSRSSLEQVSDANPVLRVAPDETLYVGFIDAARHKLRVYELAGESWRLLSPSLDVYNTRTTAQLELDAQGRPLVAADDRAAGTSSVFAWRDESWVELGPPIADRAGCSMACPYLAVAPNGDLYAMGGLNGRGFVSHYGTP